MVKLGYIQPNLFLKSVFVETLIMLQWNLDGKLKTCHKTRINWMTKPTNLVQPWPCTNLDESDKHLVLNKSRIITEIVFLKKKCSYWFSIREKIEGLEDHGTSTMILHHLKSLQINPLVMVLILWLISSIFVDSFFTGSFHHWNPWCQQWSEFKLISSDKLWQHGTHCCNLNQVWCHVF